MNILSVNSLSFQHRSTEVFKNAHLGVKKGEITGIIGSNGAGKTTLFDLICNLRTPSSGTIENLADRYIYLSQTLSAPATLKLSDIYKMISTLSSPTTLSMQQIRMKFNTWNPELSNRFEKIWNKKPDSCSYGEIRCFITLSLLTLPTDLIILDEPTAGVDPEFRYYTWLFLKKAKASGATVLVSSHSIDEIAGYCDSFYMIENKQFTKYQDGNEFMIRQCATNLDQAFINASLKSHPAGADIRH